MQVRAIATSQLHSRYHGKRWGQLLCVLSVCLSLLAGMPSAVAAAEEVTEISAQQSLPETQKVQSSQTDSSAQASVAAVATPVYHQEAYIKAPVNFSGLEFGTTVAVDGDTVVVGASYQSSKANVYVRDGRGWLHQATLAIPQGIGLWGMSIAISGDTIVVGGEHAMSSGAAYVFVRDGASWSLQAILQPLVGRFGDLFGRSVSIFGDTIIVGSIEEDSGASGVDGNPQQGFIDGAGAAYVFVRNGTQWQQQAYLKSSTPQAGEHFGHSVTIFGNTAAVISYFPTSVTIYERDNTVWSKKQQLPLNGVRYPRDYMKLSDNTLRVDNNLFVKNGTTWALQAQFALPQLPVTYYAQEYPGNIGDKQVIGSDGADEVYVYSWNGNEWSLNSTLIASNQDFGTLFGGWIAVDGDTIIVSDTQEKSDSTGINGHQSGFGAPGSGAVYIFSTRPVPTATCAGLAQEAESGLLTTPFIIGDDPAASGGKYITSPEGSGDYPFQAIRPYKAEYCFTIPSDGLYRIKTNAYAADGNDSFYVLVDDKPAKGFVWDVLPNTTYAVDYVNDRGNSDPVLVSLSAGQHTVSFHVREDGTRLDRIELEKVAEFPITPICDGLVREAESGTLTGAFQIGYDIKASQSQFVYAPEGTGNFYDEGFTPSHKAEYCFNVPTAGTYRILSKAYGTVENNVFYVQVDGAPAQGYLWDISPNTTYEYGFVNDRGKADPLELQLSAGQHTIAFYVGNDGARIDTIELQNVAEVPNSCGGLVQEAEDGIRSGNFVVASDAAASNGQYIHTPINSGNLWNGPSIQHKADYCFNVDTAGIYRIKGKVYGVDSLSDSFYVQVDTAPPTAYLWDIFRNTTYASNYVRDRGIASPLEIPLTAGPHTVTIYAREEGTRLDTIELELVSADVNATPTCAGLTQEAEDGALVGNFTAEPDAAASGGMYIHTPNGSGDFWNGPNARQKAVYCFNVPYAGGYRIDGSVLGMDALSDSFYIQVDDAPTNGYLWDVKSGDSYTRDSVRDRNVADPVYVTLASGQHTVTVYAREDGTRLDTIQLVPTIPSEGGRAIPLLAQGIHGTLRINATGLTQEIDFTQITVALVDAESNGQSFSQQVQADRFGQFHFDGMMPGQYVVRLALPDGLTSSVNEVTVPATADEASNASFDLAVQPEETDAGSRAYLPLINR